MGMRGHFKAEAGDGHRGKAVVCLECRKDILQEPGLNTQLPPPESGATQGAWRCSLLGWIAG